MKLSATILAKQYRIITLLASSLTIISSIYLLDYITHLMPKKKNSYSITQEQKDLAAKYEVLLADLGAYHIDIESLFEIQPINPEQKVDTVKGDLPRKMVDEIRAIVKDLGINPTQIPIVYWNEIEFAAADNISLYINPQDFKMLSYEEKCFVLAHEMTHYVQQDGSVRMRLNKILKKNKTTDQSLSDQLTYFQELRADITAMQRGTLYAHGAIKFFERSIRNGADVQGGSYPTDKYRLQAANHIVRQLTS